MIETVAIIFCACVIASLFVAFVGWVRARRPPQFHDNGGGIANFPVKEDGTTDIIVAEPCGKDRSGQ